MYQGSNGKEGKKTKEQNIGNYGRIIEKELERRKGKWEGNKEGRKTDEFRKNK